MVQDFVQDPLYTGPWNSGTSQPTPSLEKLSQDPELRKSVATIEDLFPIGGLT